MKKEYTMPRMGVVIVNHSQPLLAGSVKDVLGNTEIELGGAGSEVGRAPLFDDMEAEINALLGQ